MEIKSPKTKNIKTAQTNLINQRKIINTLSSKKNSCKKIEKIKQNTIQKISISLDSSEIDPLKKTINTTNKIKSNFQTHNPTKNQKFLNSKTNCSTQDEKNNKYNKPKNDNNPYKEVKILKINVNNKFSPSINNINKIKIPNSENKQDINENKQEDITDYIDINEDQFNKEYNFYKEIRNEAIEEVEEAKEVSECRYTSSSFQKSNTANENYKRNDIKKNKIRIDNENINKPEKIIFRNKLKNSFIENNGNILNEDDLFFKKSINFQTQIHHKKKEKLNTKTNNTFDHISNKEIIINNNIININSINDNEINLNRDNFNDFCNSRQKDISDKKADKIIFKKEANQKGGNKFSYNKKSLKLRMNDDYYIEKSKLKNSKIYLEKSLNPYKNLISKSYKTFNENKKTSKFLAFSSINTKINNNNGNNLYPIFNNCHNSFTIVNIFDSNNSSLNSIFHIINNITDKKVIINSNSYESNLVKTQKHSKYKDKLKKTFKKLLSDNNGFNELKRQNINGNIQDICTTKVKLSKSHAKIKKIPLFDERLKNPFASKQQSSFVDYSNKSMKILNIYETKKKLKTLKNIHKSNRILKKDFKTKSIFKNNNFSVKSVEKIEFNNINNENYYSIGQNSVRIIHDKTHERLERKKISNNPENLMIKKICLINDHSMKIFYKNKLNKSPDKNATNRIISINYEIISN